MTTKSTPLQKPLDCIQALLTVKQSKRARIHSKPETIDRITNTILMQMITGDSPGKANETLELMGELLFDFTTQILKSPSPLKTLEHFKSINQQDKGKKIFTASPTTVNRHIGNITKKTADSILHEGVKDISNNLKKQGLWSSSTLCAIDPNHQLYRGKYINGQINWGTVGQKPMYKRAFKEVAIYATTSQMVTNVTTEPILPNDKWKRPLPGWIQQIQQFIVDMKAQGTKVRGIIGDREYYSSIGNAFSYLGLWDASCPSVDNPRLITPRKIWGDRDQTKWDYLITPDSTPIIEDTIELDYYFQKFLGSYVHHLPKNKSGTRFYVPVAQVAVFDAYGNGKKIKSLEWGKKRAIEITQKIQDAKTYLQHQEEAFLKYISQFKNREHKKPSYHGARRRKFNNSREKILYNACYSAHDRIKFWKKEKEKLSRRVMFFTVSLRECEDLETIHEEVTLLVRGYRERWGVESLFKDVHYSFRVKTNSRRGTGRHVRFILSALVYNAWHYYRLTRLARIIKRKRRKWKPFYGSIVPFRKKIERKYAPLLSAGGFLHLLLGCSLKICMKRMIFECRKK